MGERAQVQEKTLKRAEAQAVIREVVRWSRPLPKRGQSIELAKGLTLTNQRGRYKLLDAREVLRQLDAERAWEEERLDKLRDRDDRRVALAVKLLGAATLSRDGIDTTAEAVVNLLIEASDAEAKAFYGHSQFHQMHESYARSERLAAILTSIRD